MVIRERRRKPRLPGDAKDGGHESDFVRQGDTEFKVVARRNKLLGLWAAERMGMTGDAAEAYVKVVIAADFEGPGDDDVVRRVMADFADKGVDMAQDGLRREIKALLDVARGQIGAEDS